MIISILNQKGGVGKTTLATNLAHYYQLAGHKSLLIDSDPQASARKWHERSGGEILDLIALDRTTLPKDAIKFKPSYSRIIIDGVPAISEMTLAAITCSDFVLIPVQPSPLDIWASKKTVELVKERQIETRGRLKAAFVVNGKFPNTVLGKEIINSLAEYDLPIFKSGTHTRQVYAKCVDNGSTVFSFKDQGAPKAIEEITNIAQEIEEFCNGLT